MHFPSGLPYIRLIPKVTAVAGETLRLKCPVAGYPIEEIKWERAGRELPDDLRHKVLPDGTLMISSVHKEIDTGSYTCWARNKQGHSARRTGEVAVIGKISLPFFLAWLFSGILVQFAASSPIKLIGNYKHLFQKVASKNQKKMMIMMVMMFPEDVARIGH